MISNSVEGRDAGAGRAGGNLRKFLGLSAGDKKQLLWAAFWLPVTHCRLRLFGLQSCLRWIGAERRGGARPEAFDAGRFEQARGCGRSVALAARHGLVAGTCLSRSLTAMRLMSRRKIAGRLRVGVRLDGGALEAHAWLEVGGVPVEPGKAGYEPFPGFDTEFGPP